MIEYPYTRLVGRTGDGEAVEVTVAVQDEYHLIDETALILAIGDSMAVREGITEVTADRFDISMTRLPEA